MESSPSPKELSDHISEQTSPEISRREFESRTKLPNLHPSGFLPQLQAGKLCTGSRTSDQWTLTAGLFAECQLGGEGTQPAGGANTTLHRKHKPEPDPRHVSLDRVSKTVVLSEGWHAQQVPTNLLPYLKRLNNAVARDARLSITEAVRVEGTLFSKGEVVAVPSTC